MSPPPPPPPPPLRTRSAWRTRAPVATGTCIYTTPTHAHPREHTHSDRAGTSLPQPPPAPRSPTPLTPSQLAPLPPSCARLNSSTPHRACRARRAAPFSAGPLSLWAAASRPCGRLRVPAICSRGGAGRRRATAEAGLVSGQLLPGQRLAQRRSVDFTERNLVTDTLASRQSHSATCSITIVSCWFFDISSNASWRKESRISSGTTSSSAVAISYWSSPTRALVLEASRSRAKPVTWDCENHL